jgi:hypothetical protein
MQNMQTITTSDRIACAIECDFGIWPPSVMIASALRSTMLDSPTALEASVKAAAEDWLRNTAAGQTALRQSSGRFHVGDLRFVLNDSWLVARLADHGVREFMLSDPIQLVGWQHDEPLAAE